MSTRDRCDPDDVTRAIAGDVAAYGRLVAASESLVRSSVRTLVRDPALADDVVQDTYLRAFRALGALRDPAAFPGWLRRVAVTTARNALRRRRAATVDPLVLDALPARLPGEEDRDGGAALDHAIARLSGADRRLLERYYRGEWTTARLARYAGVSEAAVRKRLQRLRDRLEEVVTMRHESPQADGAPLPTRIVELLSRPLLIDLPENPVGEVWERIVALSPDLQPVDLPEELDAAEVEALLPGSAEGLPEHVHVSRPGHFLRYDLTVPMLLAARGRPVGSRLIAAGKVFRDAPEDDAHLQAFHQAELFWSFAGSAEWIAMDALVRLLDELLPGARLRVEEVTYPLYAERGFEVRVQDGDGWTGVAGWARYADPVAGALGLQPRRESALGVGLGLERIAALRHGIADLRHVARLRLGR